MNWNINYEETKLILASKSARRREILSNAGFVFDILEAKSELDIIGKKYNKDLVVNCAKGKAKSVYDYLIEQKSFQNDCKNVIIISSDTIVVSQDEIIGKPKNREDAHSIISKLSGTTHFVETAICILKYELKNPESFKLLCESDKTYVTFRKLNYEEIYKYIDEYPPYDKSGSYGIQDGGNDFVTKVEGDMDTVIGFSMKVFKKLINKVL